MALSEPVIIRLELEGVKHQILHAMHARSTDIEKRVEEQLTRALDSWDFGRTIDAVVQAEVPKLIEKAVERAIQRIAFSDELQAVLEPAVRSGIAAALKPKDET